MQSNHLPDAGTEDSTKEHTRLAKRALIIHQTGLWNALEKLLLPQVDADSDYQIVAQWMPKSKAKPKRKKK